MTVTAQYSAERYNINPSQTYGFNFQHIGAESIAVYEVNSTTDPETITLVSPSDYDLTLSGTGPTYQSGTVVFTRAHGPDIDQVLIQRETPRTQLVDYQDYDPFPAQTHEFALDKTMMAVQELVGNVVGGSGGGGTPVEGQYVPLAGTAPGQPIYGALEQTFSTQSWVYGNIFGGLGIVEQNNSDTGFAIWMKGEPMLSVTDEGEVQGGPSFVMDGTEDDNTLATKKYVDDITGGPSGSFIPLAGTTSGNEVFGAVDFENGGIPGVIHTITPVALANTLTIGAKAATQLSGVQVTAADGANLFSWAFQSTGQLTMPDIDYGAADDLAAVSKQYVDDAVSTGGGAFVPLAGTAPTFPITGELEWNFGIGNGVFRTGIVTGDAGQLTNGDFVLIGGTGNGTNNKLHLGPAVSGPWVAIDNNSIMTMYPNDASGRAYGIGVRTVLPVGYAIGPAGGATGTHPITLITQDVSDNEFIWGFVDNRFEIGDPYDTGNITRIDAVLPNISGGNGYTYRAIEVQKDTGTQDGLNIGRPRSNSAIADQPVHFWHRNAGSNVQTMVLSDGRMYATGVTILNNYLTPPPNLNAVNFVCEGGMDVRGSQNYFAGAFITDPNSSGGDAKLTWINQTSLNVNEAFTAQALDLVGFNTFLLSSNRPGSIILRARNTANTQNYDLNINENGQLLFRGNVIADGGGIVP